MIYTLTTNPSIDMNMSMEGLKSGKVNRANQTTYTPNGKGLNVSFVLKHYGIPSTILGFFGGFSGNYIVDEFKKAGHEVKPIWVEDVTRINVSLFDGEAEYKCNNQGSYVPRDKQDELLYLVQKADDMECLAISGSLPPGIDVDYYDEILSVCKRKGIEVILDISSPKMAELLKYQPLLIKPNDEELMEVYDMQIQSEEDAIAALELLHHGGAQNVLLTMGDRGSYFYNGTHVYYASAQPIQLLSSACAGDSALAAFLSVWFSNRNEVESALKLSAATGANVAESLGIGTLDKVSEYKHNIQVKIVK